MPLVIIKADEVRDGEPRLWAVNEDEAVSFLHIYSADAMRRLLHGHPHASFDWCRVAIVDRPESADTEAPVSIPSPPAIDPRREVFWSAAFCAALTTRMVESAASVADLALAEWDYRWGGAK